MRLIDPGFAFVLGILAVPAVVNLQALTPSGRADTTVGRLAEVGAALDAYADLRGRYPPAETGLSALRRPNPDAPLVEPELRFVDGWGNRLVYEDRPGGFVLTSAGRDGRLGTADDQVTAR